MAIASSPNVKLRNVALPVEHGGWVFLMEPLLLGLLLTPSLSGMFCGLAAFGVFLLYQPLQLTLKDRRRGKRYPRTAWAERFVFVYGAIVVSGGLGMILTSSVSVWNIFPVIVVVAPVACLQLGLVVRGYSKAALTEVCGGLALGGTLPAILILGGWTPSAAFALWLIPAVRAVTSILYVRTRLALVRTANKARNVENISKLRPVVAHVVAILPISFMVLNGALPVGSLIALFLLLGRAFYGVYLAPRNVPARVIGFQELGYGVVVLMLVVLSYRW